MLYHNYTPETVFSIVEDFCENIYKLDAYLMLEIDLCDFKDSLYGKIFRNGVSYTKGQIAKYFRENEFGMCDYISNLNIVSYIDVEGFPVNFGNGEKLINPNVFTSENNDILEKSLHELLCKYQAAYLMEILLRVLNQYISGNQFINQEFQFELYYFKENNKALKAYTILVQETKNNLIDKIASLSLFTDYKKDLVKLIVSTKFLNLNECNKEGMIKVSVKDYVEFNNHVNYNDEIDFKESILNQLNFKNVSDKE